MVALRFFYVLHPGKHEVNIHHNVSTEQCSIILTVKIGKFNKRLKKKSHVFH